MEGDPSSIRERHRLGDVPVILSLGHVIPIRSRLPLMRALPYIVKEFPDVQVLIVGEVYDDEFRRVADELGVSEHVIATGPVAHGEVRDYLAAATIAAHDLDGHMLGISTLESMAAGVPSVRARCGVMCSRRSISMNGRTCRSSNVPSQTRSRNASAICCARLTFERAWSTSNWSS